jgi:hypothetical protein
MASNAIEVCPIAGALGAEIFGLDLANRCPLLDAVDDHGDCRRAMHRPTPAGISPL